ncbi:MAG: TIGR01777 family oxidoreductase [Candidatus Binatia bacterium]|nr:TIGR01777 family oxidoreductase [Candidatus Binatia bacterium]
MKVLISGASGLMGRNLVRSLTEAGHEVLRLVRAADSVGIPWDPRGGELDRSPLEGFDAVVHLAGESIAEGRWTVEKKKRIRDSRIEGTNLLARSLSELDQPPKVLVCASAVGFYGDRGEEILDESAPPGVGFLAEVCREWEAAADPAREKGIRVVHLRFGVVLSGEGGALAKMLLPFRLGLGGILGDGSQYMSWIALDDAVGIVLHAISHEDLRGAVNAVSPNPVTNREYTKTLGGVLRRPTVIPLPSFGARLAFGEMADELLLASVRVSPKRLLETGYDFRFAELEEALVQTTA